MKSPKEPQDEHTEGGVSRRDLMRAVGLSAGGAALFGSTLTSSTAHAATNVGAVSHGPVALAIDSTGTYLESAEGGNAVAAVVAEPADSAPTQRKRTGTVRYEELRLQVGLAAMAPPLAAWVSDTMLKAPVRKSGALVYFDANMQEMKRLEFREAVLSEIGLPECDAGVAGKAAIITLCLAPLSTRLVGPGGPPVTFQAIPLKTPLTHMFQLSIQGLEAPCRMVQKVSAISAKRPQPAAGDQSRSDDLAVAPLDCSLVTISLREKDAAPFYAWFTDFALKGNNGRDGERPGRIEWLGTNLNGIVAADLGNLGIVRYAPGAQRIGVDGTSPTQIDMYCESWSLRYL